RLWDVSSGKPLETLRGHTNWVRSASFSPDGKMLATASSDNTARLWQVFSTQELIDYANEQVPRCLTQKQRQDFFLSNDSTWDLIETGEQLAKTGEIQQAISQFQQAKQQAPCFKFDPTDKARRLAAGAQIETGKTSLIEGKIDDAIVAFNRAIEIDSRFNGLPLVVNYFMEKGEKLAKQGKIAAAVVEFKKAKELVPSFGFEPETKAKQFFAKGLVEQGQELANKGEIDAAIANYQQAQQMDASLKISAQQWNSLCWFGSVYGQAAKVMNACEKAVTLAPDSWSCRNSRGLARALTGNIQGAIEDYQFAIENYDDEGYKTKAQGWLEVLKKGENPFTEEMLKELR
ncbi:MAG: hypothetical protein DRR19_28880, partial [Candidatus Parabeggiatoa sp. nov. 1]